MIAGKHCVLLISVILFCGTSLASTELKDVQFRYYTSEQLTRLPEYFTGKEFTGSRMFCRSSKDRTGLYFSFPLDKEFLTLPTDSIINLSIIRSSRKSIEEFIFKLPDERRGKKDLFLGLTGKDWPSDDARPIAWKIEILNSSKVLLFWKKSFLWDHD